MSKYNNEEQKFIEIFSKKDSNPSKKFERNLDKLMQEKLLNKKSNFFTSFSFYFASIALIIFAGTLSGSFLYVFTNSNQQSANNIRILSDSEKQDTIQKINKNNLSFLKEPQKIEEQIEFEENTQINKTSIKFTRTPYTPVCVNQRIITEYNIYTYTEAGEIHVKEEIKTDSGILEKITKDSETPVYYYNGQLTQDSEIILSFQSEDLNYDLSNNSLVFDESQSRYMYKIEGAIDCEPIVYTETEPTSYIQNYKQIQFDREIYINQDTFKIYNEVIKQKDGTQIYYIKEISNSKIVATITNLKPLFRIK